MCRLVEPPDTNIIDECSVPNFKKSIAFEYPQCNTFMSSAPIHFCGTGRIWVLLLIPHRSVKHEQLHSHIQR